MGAISEQGHYKKTIFKIFIFLIQARSERRKQSGKNAKNDRTNAWEPLVSKETRDVVKANAEVTFYNF